MKVYILQDTETGGEIIGVYSNEILAKEKAIKRCTPPNGMMSEMDKFNLKQHLVWEYTIDENL